MFTLQHKVFLSILCIFIIPTTLYSIENGQTQQINALIDSLERSNEIRKTQNELIKAYSDSLFVIQKINISQDEKIAANDKAIDRWSVYCGIIITVIIAFLTGLGIFTNRSTKEIAHKEMREAQEEMNLELKRIKDLGVEANKEYTKFNTMLQTLLMNASKSPRP